LTASIIKSFVIVPDDEKTKPTALLFVCGQDGRFNKGSMSVLKYLFRGGVGRDLFEGGDTFNDPNDEPLEELVLFIKRNSVSIICRSYSACFLLY
jgi:hypothetical protein